MMIMRCPTVRQGGLFNVRIENCELEERARGYYFGLLDPPNMDTPPNFRWSRVGVHVAKNASFT